MPPGGPSTSLQRTPVPGEASVRRLRPERLASFGHAGRPGAAGIGLAAGAAVAVGRDDGDDPGLVTDLAVQSERDGVPAGARPVVSVGTGVVAALELHPLVADPDRRDGGV